MVSSFALRSMLVALAVSPAITAQSTLHPLLAERLETAPQGEQVAAYLVMSEQLTLGELEDITRGHGAAERRAIVVSALKAHAKDSQHEVRTLLAEAALAGRAAVDEILWAGNAIVFTAEASVIESLAGLAGVNRVRPIAERDVREYHDVTPAPMLASAGYPFFEDFETGVLSSAWTVATSGTGVVEVTSNNMPEGNFHVTMASSVDSSDSTATITVSLDLVGQSNVGLRFLHKEFSDEIHVEDGVFLSDDGGASWHAALSLTTGSTVYGTRSVELDDAIATLGLVYTNDFRIRFSWRDNFAIPFDGFAFDNIEIAPGVGGQAPELNLEKLQAPQLWDIGVTGEDVLIVNIDSGTDITHPDLASNLWTNVGEIPGNGVDDDANGKIDDVHGWDFAADDGNPDSPFSAHGTQTAGLMVGDGTAGVTTGMAPGATMLATRVDNEPQYWAAQQYAIEVGADVISSSFSFKWSFVPKPDYAMHRQICDVELAVGIIHANSTGNQGGSTVSHPVPFNVPAPGNVPQPWGHPDAEFGGRSAVLGCAGIQLDDTLYTSSGVGPAAWEDITLYDGSYPHVQSADWFDYAYGGFGGSGPGLLKPDVSAYTNSVISTTPGGGYSSFTGTSAATPQLGGGLALLRSHQPAAFPRHVAAAVELTAGDLGPAGKDTRFGAGKLQVFDAARRLLIVGAADSLTPAIGDTLMLDITAVPGSAVATFFGPSISDSPSGFNLGLPFFWLALTNIGASGSASVPLAIPNDAVLVDVLIHFQFASKVADSTTWGPGTLLSVPETVQITN